MDKRWSQNAVKKYYTGEALHEYYPTLLKSLYETVENQGKKCHM